MTGPASTNSNNSLRLRQAIQSNDIPLVERLLQAQPNLLHNPDHTDKANTSLHLAAQAGHAELCVGWLCARTWPMTDIHIRNYSFRKAMMAPLK